MSSIFDARAFDESLFFPRADDREPPPNARDLMIDVGGASLHARWHPSDDARATVIAFHGNGEIVSDYDGIAPRYRQAGAELVVVDFRGYGRSTGTPRYRDCIADSVVAVTAILERSPKRPVIVLGRSLGGACAAEIARQESALVDGIVLESAASDLRGLIRRRGLTPPAAFTDDELRVFDPARKLARCRLPALVLHGAQDTLISPDEARANLTALGSADKKLVLLPGVGHNDVMGSPQYWSALGAFVARVVG